MLANVSVRQQRRAERYRVEVLTHSSVLISADVLDSGRVELYESSAAALVKLSGEKKAFAGCLSRFRHRRLHIPPRFVHRFLDARWVDAAVLHERG